MADEELTPDNELDEEREDGFVDPDFVDKPDIKEEDEEPDKEPFDEHGYQEIDFYENLAPLLTPTEHEKLIGKYLNLYEIDKNAREKRDKQYEEGIKRTGVSNDAPGGADFQGASKTVHPGLAEACIDFCARSMKEIFPAAGPVRIKIDGKLTKAKIDRAERKKRHMNWQFTKQIREYRSVLEQVLTQLPLGGAEFIKFYPDFLKKRPACEFVRIDHVHFPYQAGDFYASQRIFHDQYLTEYERDRRITAGIYDEEEKAVSAAATTPDLTKTQIQMDKAEGKEPPTTNEDGTTHYIDGYIFDELEVDDKVSKELGDAPYYITINNESRKIVGLYRNWDEEDETQQKLDWMVKFGFLPWDGALEIGLPHIIGTLSGGATGALRSLLDAALTQNIPTGVMLDGTTVTGQSASIGPTKITKIKSRAVGIDDINKVFMHLPFNQPSTVLFQLLQFLDAKIGGVVRTTSETAEDNQNMPVGTKLANIEQAMVVYSSIHQRLHAAQEKCLEIVHRINRYYMDEKPYDAKLGFAVKADYEGEIDVQPVSDPNIFSESQRFGQLQAALQLLQLFPQAGFDARAIIKWAFSIMRIPNQDEILPDPQKPKDENPVAENIMMAMGQPAIALPDQDHLAHLQVLLDFAQSKLMGQNPLIMQKFLPLAVQHGMQHVLYQYAEMMNNTAEKALGVSLSDIQDEDPSIARKFSQLVAKISPTVIAQLPPVLDRAIGILLQLNQMAQSMQQPPLPHPLQVEAEKVKNEAQNNTEKNQIASQNNTQKNQIQSQKVQIDAQDNQKDLEQKQTETEAKLLMNREDNQTAEQIASMRVVTGGSPGALKDGTSLGNNP